MQKVFRASAKPELEIISRDARREICASAYLTEFLTPFFPAASGALRPSCLLTIANVIALTPGRRVLEFGCGLSTLIIARILRKTGGTLLSIEQSPEWTAIVNAQLAAEGLQDVATVAVVPQIDTMDASVLKGETFDLVIVDGPAGTPTRVKTFPIFSPCLSSDFTVIVDDLPRGMIKHIKEWGDALGTEFKQVGDFAIASTYPIKFFGPA